MDENDPETLRQEKLLQAKKDRLLKWLSRLEQVSLEADEHGEYSTVEIYDLQKQILESLLKTLVAINADKSYLYTKKIKFQLRPDILRLFPEADQSYLLEIMNGSQ